jgi:hypothetical protein
MVRFSVMRRDLTGRFTYASKQKQGRCAAKMELWTGPLGDETLSDAGMNDGSGEMLQGFRVRAGALASVHGRPDGVPGRSAGARAKALRD